MCRTALGGLPQKGLEISTLVECGRKPLFRFTVDAELSDATRGCGRTRHFGLSWKHEGAELFRQLFPPLFSCIDSEQVRASGQIVGSEIRLEHHRGGVPQQQLAESLLDTMRPADHVRRRERGTALVE